MNWKRRKSDDISRLRRVLESLLLVVVLGSGFGGGAAAAPVDNFTAAGRLYDSGNFAEAIAAYEKVSPKTPHVFYNLGNACFRAGNMGKAILNYERACRLSPRDPDILANLRFAEERAGVESVNSPSSMRARLLSDVLYHLTMSEWAGCELIGLWGLALGIGLSLWIRNARTALVAVSVVACVTFAVSAPALLYRSARYRTSPPAVVTAGRADTRFAPLAEGTVHFKLAEGSIVRVIEDRGPWVFIERADGQQGWVETKAVELLGIP